MAEWRGSVARGIIALYFATGVGPKEARLAHFEDPNLKKMTFFVRHPEGKGAWAFPTEVDIIRPDVVPLTRGTCRRGRGSSGEGA